MGTLCTFEWTVSVLVKDRGMECSLSERRWRRSAPKWKPKRTFSSGRVWKLDFPWNVSLYELWFRIFRNVFQPPPTSIAHVQIQCCRWQLGFFKTLSDSEALTAGWDDVPVPGTTRTGGKITYGDRALKLDVLGIWKSSGDSIRTHS